jgi:hypothetical protein
MKATVAVGIMREDYYHSFMPFDIAKNDVFFLHTTDSIFRSEQEYYLMQRGAIGIDIFGVPKNMVDIEHRCITSKFTIGDIVVNDKLKDPIAFRIYAIQWDRVDFWNCDGWGLSQGLASGVYDADLRYAHHNEIQKSKLYIEHYDQLMDKKTKVFRTLPGC